MTETFDADFWQGTDLSNPAFTLNDLLTQGIQQAYNYLTQFAHSDHATAQFSEIFGYSDSDSGFQLDGTQNTQFI